MFAVVILKVFGGMEKRIVPAEWISETNLLGLNMANIFKFGLSRGRDMVVFYSPDSTQAPVFRHTHKYKYFREDISACYIGRIKDSFGKYHV